jgi:hypothetical protein
MAIIMAAMSIFMLLAGISNNKASPTKVPTYTTADLFSIANIDYSTPVCIQQYVDVNLPREINCLQGNETQRGVYIGSLSSVGII